RVERLFGAVEVLGDAQGIAELRPGTAAQVGGPGGTLRPQVELGGDGGGETGVLHGRGRVLPAERPTSFEESLDERGSALSPLDVGEGFGTSRGELGHDLSDPLPLPAIGFPPPQSLAEDPFDHVVVAGLARPGCPGPIGRGQNHRVARRAAVDEMERHLQRPLRRQIAPGERGELLRSWMVAHNIILSWFSSVTLGSDCTRNPLPIFAALRAVAGPRVSAAIGIEVPALVPSRRAPASHLEPHDPLDQPFEKTWAIFPAIRRL